MSTSLSTSKTPPQLAHFTRLNQSVWYHRPSSSPSSNEPTLIVLVGWMDASPKHLSKYTAGYEALYPSSSILAITTKPLDAILWSEAANIRRIDPALDILCALDVTAKVLVHLFSDGGSFTTTRLAMGYKKRMQYRMPIDALILDSSPGKATYHDTVRAFAVSLPPNHIIQVIGGLVLRLGWGLYILGYKVQGKVNMVEKNRQMLNDKRMIEAEAKRLYIYSTKDDMVSWKLVEEHAADAKQKGWVVSMESNRRKLAAPFSLYYVLLSSRVFSERVKSKVYIGDSPPSSSPATSNTKTPHHLATLVRCHSNFLENVPFAFIFLIVAELNGGNRKALHYVMAALLALRVAHADFGLMLQGKFGDNGIGRPIGYVGSNGVLVGLAGYAAYLTKGYWGF